MINGCNLVRKAGTYDRPIIIEILFELLARCDRCDHGSDDVNGGWIYKVLSFT